MLTTTLPGLNRITYFSIYNAESILLPVMHTLYALDDISLTLTFKLPISFLDFTIVLHPQNIIIMIIRDKLTFIHSIYFALFKLIHSFFGIQCL
jgi:hypothetical protein